MEINILKCLRSQKDYANSVQYRKMVLNNNHEAIQTVQQVVSQIIRSKQSKPIEKTLAVRLIKDCIETFNDEIIEQTQKTVLVFFEQIAIFRYQDKSDDRGVNIFSVNPTREEAQLGNSLLRLVLECIIVWSKWFPIDPTTQMISNYKLCMEKLLRMGQIFYKIYIYILGVKFPQLLFFDIASVEKHLPEQMVPRAMLKECSHIIIHSLHQDSHPQTYQLQQQLSLTVKACVINQYIDIFYTDIMHRCVKKILGKFEDNCLKLITNQIKFSNNNFQPLDQDNQIDKDKVMKLEQENKQLKTKIHEQESEIKRLKDMIYPSASANIAQRNQSLIIMDSKVQPFVGQQNYFNQTKISSANKQSIETQLINRTQNEVYKIPQNDVYKKNLNDPLKTSSNDFYKRPSNEVYKLPSNEVHKLPSNDVYKLPTNDVYKSPSNRELILSNHQQIIKPTLTKSVNRITPQYLNVLGVQQKSVQNQSVQRNAFTPSVQVPSFQNPTNGHLRYNSFHESKQMNKPSSFQNRIIF